MIIHNCTQLLEINKIVKISEALADDGIVILSDLQLIKIILKGIISDLT
jgi:hypothetical protein